MPRDLGSPMKGTWRRRYRRLLDLPPGMLRGRILYRAKLPIFAGGPAAYAENIRRLRQPDRKPA